MSSESPELSRSLSGTAAMSIVVGKSSIVADARNLGLEYAQKYGAEYVLFIDSDMTFPKDALLKLLVRQVDIIGATYSRRTAPFHFLGDILPEQPADAPKIGRASCRERV